MSDCFKGWDAITIRGNLVAVVPRGDSHRHFEHSQACPCRPKIIFENRVMIIIHNSFDGREYHEPNNKKYKLLQ